MMSSEKPPWDIVQQAMGNMVQVHVENEIKASLFLPGPSGLFFRLCLKDEKEAARRRCFEDDVGRNEVDRN